MLHDVQTLLQTIGTTTIRIIVFCIGIVTDSVEVVNGSSAITLSDAQHACILCRNAECLLPRPLSFHREV